MTKIYFLSTPKFSFPRPADWLEAEPKEPTDLPRAILSTKNFAPIEEIVATAIRDQKTKWTIVPSHVRTRKFFTRRRLPIEQTRFYRSGSEASFFVITKSILQKDQRPQKRPLIF